MGRLNAFPGLDVLVAALVIASFVFWLATQSRRPPVSTKLAEPRGGAFAALRLFERKLLLIGVGFATIASLGVFAILRVCGVLDIAAPWTFALVVAWLFGGRFALLRLRYPGALRLDHSLVIHAAPDVVWNTVTYRPTTDYYRATVARIVRQPGQKEIYDLHIRDLGTCPRCGLPKPPDRSTKKVSVEIVDRIEGRRERTRATTEGQPFRPAVLEEQNEWRIEPHAEGALVSRTSLSKGPLLWFWLTARFRARNPTRDNLVALKAHLEGARGTGSFAAAREMLDAARAAPEHCRCEGNDA